MSLRVVEGARKDGSFDIQHIAEFDTSIAFVV